jgi:aryl-alcohol dehydrogenase-like predicted oxidoreductase
MDGRYSKENFPKILDVVSRIDAIGEKHNATAGQVTLAWVLAQGNDFVVIPGTKKIKVCSPSSFAVSVRSPHVQCFNIYFW